jgi:hypothetical protein
MEPNLRYKVLRCSGSFLSTQIRRNVSAKARGNILAICNLIVVFHLDCLRRSPQSSRDHLRRPPLLSLPPRIAPREPHIERLDCLLMPSFHRKGISVISTFESRTMISMFNFRYSGGLARRNVVGSIKGDLAEVNAIHSSQPGTRCPCHMPGPAARRRAFRSP